MKILLTNILLCVFSISFSQTWEEVANTQYQSLRTFYVDPIDSLLYIGGHFRYMIDGADTVDARGIVSWDGNMFANLDFFPNSGCANDYNCNPVISIIRFQDEIYCTLYNSSLEVQSTDEIMGLARWDGIKWDTVGAGVRGIVYEQRIYKDELYVMGRFPEAGNLVVNGIAKWDGNEWHDVGFPYYYDEDDAIDIFASMVHNDELYVAGNFWSADETVKDVAKYDGENWHPVGNGVQGGWDDVGDIIVYKDEIYICGDFKAAAGNAGNKIMKLVNNEWIDVGGSFSTSGVVHEMLIWDDLLYVFGGFSSLSDGTPFKNIAMWDGEKWCGSTTYFNGKILRAIRYQDNLIIRGSFTDIDGQIIRKFAKWDGGHLADTCQDLSTNLAVNQQKKITLSISPNPTTQKIHFHLQKLPIASVARITLINPFGKVVLKTQQTLQSQNTLDVEHLPGGVYFLTVEMEGQRYVRKVVLQK